MENKYILLVVTASQNNSNLTNALAKYTHETQNNVYLIKTNVSTQEFLVGIRSMLGDSEPLILRVDGASLTQGILPSQLQSFVTRSQAA